MEETQEEVAEEEAEAEEVELPGETPTQVRRAQDRKVYVRHLETTFSITVKKGLLIRCGHPGRRSFTMSVQL